MQESIKVGIAGYGEIGYAINEILWLKDTSCRLERYINDPFKKLNGDLSKCDYVHICTPSDQVEAVIRKFGNSPVYIIHSTVKPGTCDKLLADFDDDCGPRPKIFHAPIRGRHPNLVKAISEDHIMMISCKRIGYPITSPAIVSYLKQFLVKEVRLVFGYVNTELAKVMCTTRLRGGCIIYASYL